MNTIVKGWQIVSVLDKGELVEEVLWGICVDDSTYRFTKVRLRLYIPDRKNK